MARAVLERSALTSSPMAVSETSVEQHDLERYRRELTGYCYRMLGSGSEAEDAVQETMLRAWRNTERFEGRSSLRSWLYRIATNVCIDMQRHSQRRARPMEMGPSSPPVESHLGPMLPECTWIGPVSDRAGVSRVLRSRRDRPVPRDHPPCLRHGAPAPSLASARFIDPVRGSPLVRE